MDSAVSRRNHTNKKGNKENTQPAHESKSFIKRDKTTVAPFQLKSNEKQETLTKNGPLKAKAKQVDTRSVSSEALKRVKTVQKDGKRAAAVTDIKKIAAEVPKPPAAVPSSKPAPGMYKGKIVQSKIGSIWKSSFTVGCAEPKPPAAKTESQRVGNVTKSRSKSVNDLPGCGTQKPSSKSLFNKPTVTSRPPAGFCSARPPARTVPATLTSTSLRSITVAPTKGSGTQNSKPNITMADKVSKPPVSSKLSQYRFTMETTEQRRARLAQWLASKGKTLKRPAMTTAAPPKDKVSAKPKVELKSQSHVEPQPATGCKPKTKQGLEAHKPDSATAAHCADTQGERLTIHSQTPAVMDTTVELLENSDADLQMDAQDRVDDIVVNLCDALEAMATPSRCGDELAQVADELDDEMEENKSEDESKKEEVQNKTLEDFGEQKFEQEKNEAEESDEHKVETDDDDDVEVVESDNEGVTTPQMESASIVKYSVKTTPYLQSVKKTIEVEASTSTSRRKSNIKDLKFLTPVRRSCRIQHNSSHLPTMLVDHDPCVSSLAELVKLDDNPNAYIYRKNPALLEHLPDQPGL